MHAARWEEGKQRDSTPASAANSRLREVGPAGGEVLPRIHWSAHETLT